MPVPEKLRDRPSHRVTDGDGTVDVETIEQRRSVVCAIGQAKSSARMNPSSVTTLVWRNHAVATAEPIEDGVPVERGRGAKPVEK